MWLYLYPCILKTRTIAIIYDMKKLALLDQFSILQKQNIDSYNLW